MWFMICLMSISSALSGTELIEVRDSFDKRRDRALQLQIQDPYPGVSDASDLKLYGWNRFSYALAALFLDAEVEEANTAIADAVDQLLSSDESLGEMEFHWLGNLAVRLYLLFGPDGTRNPNLLNPKTADAIRRLLWEWAKSEAQIKSASPGETWFVWGSENHEAMRDATAWGTAMVLKDVVPYNSYKYDDGSTAAEQYGAWNRFLKEYLRERVKKGLLVEIASNYGKYTTQGWYNFHDFSEDPELRSLARDTLHVWWTDYAQEQFDGVRGGSKSRCYQGSDSRYGSHDDTRQMFWYHFGRGYELSRHPSIMCMLTSTYRLPLVILDIGLDHKGRGVYECKSRRVGKHLSYDLSMSLSTDRTPFYTHNPDDGGIFRYTYCTPDFIMGTSMLENLPHTAWTNISMQNRWHGVIFGGNIESRIFPQCIGDKATYNQQWSIQNEGTMIVQKLTGSGYSLDMRVWFSSDLKLEEADGWVLAQAPSAFAAVYVVRGGYGWDDQNWLHCTDEYSPIIIEAACGGHYGNSYEQFRSAVLAQNVFLEDGVLSYQGLGDSGDFTFYPNSGRLPELNGTPISFAPDYTFDSPFMYEEWASGIVHITKGRRELRIDVRKGLQ
ncbi:hypothetical protein ACFL6S_23790 [Candidatus Poribacteria bacterium]